MGRHAGWIALHSGLAGGAHVILVPEQPFDVDAVADRLTHRHRHGHSFSIVVVAEGAVPVEGTMTLQAGEVDEFGHVRLGGVGNRLASELESRTGFETRVVVLGHLLRGGTPTAFDRILATRFGLEAIDAANEGDFGKMVALRGTDIIRVPFEAAVGELKTVPPERLTEAEVFFG
jgi:6-phosphofructokinase 1